MKQAFTLIELLIVVLIIGILSAVALPQYRLAVLKARFVQIQVAMRHFKDAAEQYKLANGTYPSSLGDLDLGLVGTFNNSAGTVTENTYTCRYRFGIQGATNELYCYLKKSPSVGVRYFLDYPSRKDILYCTISKDDALGNKLCASVGGVDPFDSGAGLMHYKLP